MVKNRKNLSLLFVVMVSICGMGLPAWAQAPFFQDGTEELRREIRLLNLVNGLELTAAQRNLILSRAGEVKESRENMEAFFLARRGELQSILGEIRSSLRENREVPQEIARRFHALELEQKKDRLALDKKTSAFASEIEKSLEPHQIYQLERYVPCIIPPKGESRIGQATDYKGLAQKLERIRSVPDRIYEQRREMICGRTVEEIKLRMGRAPDLEEDKIALRIGSFYDRVRSLSQTDFEIQKEKLAEEFVSILKPGRLALDVTRKIEAFLLAPEIIPVLENGASPLTGERR
jgi:hypothetical protein